MRQVGRKLQEYAHVHPRGVACVFCCLTRLAMIGAIGLAFTLLTWHPTPVIRQLGLTCAAEANGKNCACPVLPGETVVLPCSSQLDPTSCGVCSVLTADRKRDGRSCVTLQ